jgi:hypothetical protein
MTQMAFAVAMRHSACSYNRLGAIIQAFALIDRISLWLSGSVMTQPHIAIGIN